MSTSPRLSSTHNHRHSRHSRSLSRDESAKPPPRSPSPPSQTHHPGSLLPRSFPTPALVESVAGGAHYSGTQPADLATIKQHSSSSNGHERRMSENHTNFKADHSKILDDLKELFGCRPTKEILERSWHKDAIFEDPLSKCFGYNEYAPQWFGMPKLFSDSKSLSVRIISSTSSPNRLVYAQTQEYTFRYFGNKKVIESIVTVDLDENEKIIYLADQWSGKEPPTRFGSYWARRANARLVPWLVHVPK